MIIDKNVAMLPHRSVVWGKLEVWRKHDKLITPGQPHAQPAYPRHTVGENDNLSQRVTGPIEKAADTRTKEWYASCV